MLPLARLAPVLAIAFGCSAPATRIKPDVAIPDRFSGRGAAATLDRWWLAFDDPALDALIDEGLAGNPGLAQTWDRLAQAEASARAAGATALPAASGDLGVSGNSGGDASLSLGLAASYEIDLWGGIGAAREAAALDAASSAADLRAAGITLSAEIAVAWVQLVEQRALDALLDRQLANAARTLELVELRFEHGAVAETDVLRQRQQVESLRGDMTQTRARIETLENRLAILVGRPPRSRLPDAVALPSLPPMPSTGVPAELIQRRPDLASSHLRIQAADRRVATAIAERFPRLDLGARLSTGGLDPQAIVTGWLASLTASLTQTLVDGGRKKAEVERARAALSERIHAYEAAILAALGEVEDAITGEVHQRELIDSLVEQTALARGVADRTEKAYAAGAVDFLRVLEAESNLQSLERRRLAATTDHIESRIALYRALAGGFEMTRPR